MDCRAVSRLAVVEFLARVFAIPLDSTQVRWLSEAVVAPLFTAVLGDERWNTRKAEAHRTTPTGSSVWESNDDTYARRGRNHG